MQTCCVDELGVIWKEIKTLKPLNIIFYTYTLFREELNQIPIAAPSSLTEVTLQTHKVPCAKEA